MSGSGVRLFGAKRSPLGLVLVLLAGTIVSLLLHPLGVDHAQAKTPEATVLAEAAEPQLFGPPHLGAKSGDDHAATQAAAASACPACDVAVSAASGAVGFAANQFGVAADGSNRGIVSGIATCLMISLLLLAIACRPRPAGRAASWIVPRQFTPDRRVMGVVLALHLHKLFSVSRT